MATQLFAQTEAQLDTYLPAYKNILSAVGFVNLNTGETVKISAEQKIAWLYMLDRYKFFKEKEQLYFDNQADIAAACGVSDRTVLRFISSLNLCGYLQINQTRIGGHKSNSYILLTDLVLVQPQKAPNKPIEAKTEQTQHITAPSQQNAVEELIEPYSDNNIPAGESFATEYIPYDDSESQWLADTQEDDGSVYDALTFSSEKIVSITSIKNNDQQKENEFSTAFFKELPEKRFNPNGMPSTEMLSFCKQNNIKVKSADGSTVFVVDGKDCTICSDGFIPYVAAAAISVSKADPWEGIPEPF